MDTKKKSTKKRRNNKKNLDMILLIVLAILSLAIYIDRTEYLQNRIYPTKSGQMFDLGFLFKNESGKYDYGFMGNKIERIEINLIRKKVEIQFYIKKLQKGDLIIIEEKDIIEHLIPNEFWKNCTSVNESDGFLTINITCTVDRPPALFVELFFEDLFFNYYKIDTRLGPINKISFYFPTDVFNGYLCSGECFSFLKGTSDKTETVFYGYGYDYTSEKEFSWGYKPFEHIRGQDVFEFRFNPQSKRIFLEQKLIDALILGLVVVFAYDGIKIKFIDRKRE